MSKCISSHGEYSEHEPGDPCPWCGEYDMPRIIAERDEALARIKAARDVHIEAEGSCATCTRGRIYPTPWPCDTIAALEGK